MLLLLLLSLAFPARRSVEVAVADADDRQNRRRMRTVVPPRNNEGADARERPRAGRSARRTRPEVTTTIACLSACLLVYLSACLLAGCTVLVGCLLAGCTVLAGCAVLVGCAVLLHLNSFISPYHSPTADRTARATVRATTRHPHGSLSVEGGATPAYLSLSDLTLIWRLYYPDTSHLGQAPLSRQTETRYRTKHYTVTSSVSHEHTYPSKQHATVRFAFCRV